MIFPNVDALHPAHGLARTFHEKVVRQTASLPAWSETPEIYRGMVVSMFAALIYERERANLKDSAHALEKQIVAVSTAFAKSYESDHAGSLAHELNELDYMSLDWTVDRGRIVGTFDGWIVRALTEYEAQLLIAGLKARATERASGAEFPG
jgi:hypothetical protein